MTLVVNEISLTCQLLLEKELLYSRGLKQDSFFQEFHKGWGENPSYSRGYLETCSFADPASSAAIARGSAVFS